MLIGVPKEVKSHEYRVGLRPAVYASRITAISDHRGGWGGGSSTHL
jgi:alanine dehydrogenase